MRKSGPALSLLVVLFLTIVGGCASPTLTDDTASTANVNFTPSSNPNSQPSTPTLPADMIFYNGNIITMERSQPIASAIAVHGTLIQAVGSDEEILSLRGSDTRMIDLQGKTLMPGFVDAHTHVLNDTLLYTDSVDYEAAQQLALRNGITTLADMYVSPEFLADMLAFDASGKLHVRTSLYLSYANACGQLQGDWYRQYLPTRQPGEMLRINGVKIYADGGSCGLSAVSFDRPSGPGDLWFTQDELNAIVIDAQSGGYQVAIHALGDRGLDMALNAIEFVLNGQANTMRYRIEHNATIRPEQLQRYSEVDVVATIFGAFPVCNGDSTPIGGQPLKWRWGDLLDANPDVHFAWSSDFPWVGPISPLLNLYSMVTPYEIISDDGTECPDHTWQTSRRLTVDEVLPLMTIEGAYALFREDEVGSLVPGKYADLIILSGDPLTVDSNHIKDLTVVMTMVGGKAEYCAKGFESLCP